MPFRAKPLWFFFLACAALFTVFGVAGVFFFAVVAGWWDIVPHNAPGFLEPGAFTAAGVTGYEWLRRRRAARAS
ncbi:MULTISPECIES: hypothetical protein [unclassified Streptomyces]|uniref:hypothetical protein n=1 Tax=unclassified Streptomyces TaxID=2593676 RepID=UPI002E27D862|nr:hypothetical protein [Streptomyces sp. NBC_00223]